MNALEVARLAARAAGSRKALRVVLQDLRGLSDVCSFQLICSGSSDRQTKAICKGIEDVLKEQAKTRPIAVEGRQNGHWILLDYGATIIHVFNNEIRDYYAIDELWPAAKAIDVG